MKKLKYLLYWIWQAPQHLLALAIIYLLDAKFYGNRRIPNTTQIARQYVSDYLDSSVSFGGYILLTPNASDKTKKHESGHSLQSLYFGWLYLIVIGLPSIAWNIVHKTIAPNRNYYDFWCEKWADKLGGVKR